MVPALAITVLAAGGCGREADPPARPVAAARPVDTVHSVPPRPAAARWMEPREPGDHCRRADGEDDRPHPSSPDGSVTHEDLGHGLAFLCTLHEGYRVRLVVAGDGDGDPVAVVVHDPPADTAGGDTLLLGESEPPYAGATILEGEDLDGDGWTDVRVMTFHGSGGHMYDVFRYQPSRRRFEKDTVLSGQGNVQRADRGCARTSWAMGAGNHSWVEQCWRNGMWVPVRGESWATDDALSTREVQVSVHEKLALRNGRLRVVSADTTRERIR